LSDYIRKGLHDKGVANPTTAQLQDEGNRLREAEGLECLVKKCIDDVLIHEEQAPFNERTVILIDGIRNTGEVQCLRVNPNFYLISVHASFETRAERLIGPAKRFDAMDEFETADERDSEEEGIPWGQKVQVCNDMADIIVNNEHKLLADTISRSQFFAKFVNQYITVLKAIRGGTRIADRPPSTDETLMTMAFCASRRSSCDRRKVGAVVAHVKEFPEIAKFVKRKEDEKRYQVIASGYNEVPLGTAPCRLGTDEVCHWDLDDPTDLQERAGVYKQHVWLFRKPLEELVADDVDHDMFHERGAV